MPMVSWSILEHRMERGSCVKVLRARVLGNVLTTLPVFSVYNISFTGVIAVRR